MLKIKEHLNIKFVNIQDVRDVVDHTELCVNLEFAVLTAVADLRWQTAKEKAAQYWMEEGITGNYYQWAYDNKLKGNLKDYFIRDYVIWITKESHGIQKLDKEVRQIFWRYLPFKQEIKDDLRNRGFAYNELYKKDINRSQSDGY